MQGEYLPSLAVLGVFLTRVLLWDYKQELGFAQDVLKKSLSWDSLLLGEKQAGRSRMLSHLTWAKRASTS